MSPTAITEDEGERKAPQPVQYPFMKEQHLLGVQRKGEPVLNVNLSMYALCVTLLVFCCCVILDPLSQNLSSSRT